MANKSKAIGTRGESAVVKYLAANGFGLAERRALHGGRDMGDILVCPGLIVEVKCGKDAYKFQKSLLEQWQEQTRVERWNADAEVALLVVQRYRKPPKDWWTWMIPAPTVGGHVLEQCWAPLWAAVNVLRLDGWGDPVDISGKDEGNG